MKALVESYCKVSGKLSDEELVELYQTDPCVAISKAYKKYAGALFSKASKAFFLNDSDKESLAFEVIDKSFRTIDLGRSRFNTWTTNLMARAVADEIRSFNIQRVQRNWYMDVALGAVSVTEEGEELDLIEALAYEEPGYSETEVLGTADLCGLNDNQYRYLQLIISNDIRPTDREAAKLLGVGVSTITGIKRALAIKLKDYI